MATITVRNLDDDVRDQLRVLAAQRGRSMEAEVRAILVAAVSNRPRGTNALMDLYWSAQAVGGYDLDVEPRSVDEPRVDFAGPEFG